MFPGKEPYLKVVWTFLRCWCCVQNFLRQWRLNVFAFFEFVWDIFETVRDIIYCDSTDSFETFYWVMSWFIWNIQIHFSTYWDSDCCFAFHILDVTLLCWFSLVGCHSFSPTTLALVFQSLKGDKVDGSVRNVRSCHRYSYNNFYGCRQL